jgi:hypothetical protein
MATQKQAQTTGGGKKSGKAASRPAPKKHDPEQSARVLLIGGVVALLVVVVGLIAFGYYWTEVRPERRTVLQVDDEKVSLAAMKRRMEYELFQSVTLQQDPTTLADVAYENLVAELIRVSRAESAGVTVDDAAFDKALRARIGVAEEGDQRAFQDALRRQLDATGLSESEYRRLVRAEALQTALTDKFKAELPANLEMAKIEVISAPSQEEAQAAIDRINAGEPFADVAKDISLETNVEETGGVHDFEAEGSFNIAYDGYVFTAPVGQLSGPLAAGGNATNVYVVRVIERSEQPVREDQKASLAADRANEWLRNTLAEMESAGAISSAFDDDDRLDAVVAVYGGAQERIIQDQIAQQEAAAVQQTAIAQLTSSPATPGPSTPAAEGTPAADTTPAAPPAVPAP